jgi:hypothetical protein
MKRCEAKLLRRGEVLECVRLHREDETPTHECDGHYWGGEGETAWKQCPATATYCGEALRCDCDIRDPERGCSEHYADSARYGQLSWSDEKRAQPSVMFSGLGMGHRYGSRENDCAMLAAATLQDAVNRLEQLQTK